MAKRSVNSGYSEWVKEPEVIDIKLSDAPPSRQVVLMKDLKLNIVGSVTGIKYTWNGAGSAVDVDERDVPAMLHRAVRRTSCCGTVPTPYFTIVGG